MDKYYTSQWRVLNVPKTVFAEGEAVHVPYFGISGVRVVGRLFNWEVEAMPQVGYKNINGDFVASTQVPLNFAGRVTVHVEEVEKNMTCAGTKLELHRGERKIM